MEFRIVNYSGENVLIFTSANKYLKSDILSNKDLSRLLYNISKRSWLNAPYDKLNELIIKIKNAAEPFLKYCDFCCIEDDTYIHNVQNFDDEFKYLYVVSITKANMAIKSLFRKTNESLVLNFNVINMEDKYESYCANDSRVSNILLLLTKGDLFICDSHQCDKNISEFDKNIRDMMRSNIASNINSVLIGIPNDGTLASIEPGQYGTAVVLRANLKDNLHNYIAKDDSAIAYDMATSDLSTRFNTKLTIIAIIFVLVIIVAIIVCCAALYFKKGDITIKQIKEEVLQSTII